jgi:zinc and cadmium transporter
MTLAWILVASVAGGTLSAGLAALALTLRATWIPMLVSFAIGALLGAAFLEIIPHAFEEGEAHQVAF